LAILEAYLDDSSDPKRQQYMAVGGIVLAGWQPIDFEVLWANATKMLTEPFRSTDCETQHGQFSEWSKTDCTRLMVDLVRILQKTEVHSIGCIVPVSDYRDVFPGSSEYDPYFLALKHTLINMAKVGFGEGDGSGKIDVRVVCEDSETTSSKAHQVYGELKAFPGWEWGRSLAGFSTAPKTVRALQAADMIAREAYKHAANLGVRKTRKPVKALHQILSFHLWTRDTLEYLRDKGSQSNLDALANWGQRGPKPPQMQRFYGSTFDMA
jgi:hypothetical protein